MMGWAKESLKKVENSRSIRLKNPAPIPDSLEQEAILKQYHPDYLGKERMLRIGPNAGQGKFPNELADLLESSISLGPDYEPYPNIETDVLIVGGGGAGTTAALALEGSGLKVHLATKLRLGDSNTVMAEGGIQSALSPDDSPGRHFADALVGGHGENDPDKLRILCEQGPESIRWLSQIGCLFDQRDDGTFRLRGGGGTSLPRVLACRDFTGLEIMRVLKDAVRLTETELLEEHAAMELVDDGHGKVTGAILFDRNAGEKICVSARAVILATGGSGQIRLQGFPTSNHVGATGDGLVLAYRQGCSLIHLDSYQYHPSGACYPEALVGQLVTEAIRSVGAQVVNADGDHFIDEMSCRDVLAGAIIKEIAEGRGIKTPHDKEGVWLDTPMVDLVKGKGTLANQFPGLIHRFEQYGIDPLKQPILIFPTLHYQNGGIRVDSECRTDVSGLWACGEVTGGLHGKNRLMGNSLLDITVFGRRSAESVLRNIDTRGTMTLTQSRRFQQEREKIKELPQTTSPKFFPDASGMKLESISREEKAEISSSLNTYEPRSPFKF